jgi:hypothetical protein
MQSTVDTTPVTSRLVLLICNTSVRHRLRVELTSESLSVRMLLTLTFYLMLSGRLGHSQIHPPE